MVALEETDGMRPGRCKIYNNKGQKATEAIPDALIPRLQFVPWKHGGSQALAAAVVILEKMMINHDKPLDFDGFCEKSSIFRQASMRYSSMSGSY